MVCVAILRPLAVDFPFLLFTFSIIHFDRCGEVVETHRGERESEHGALSCNSCNKRGSIVK